MLFLELLDKKHIYPDLQQRDKESVLLFLSEEMDQEYKSELEGANTFSLVHESETRQSMAIGNGIAIPHIKVEGLKSQILFLARSRVGIDFQSIDDKPVHLIFLLASPSSEPEKHCKTIAGISKLLHNSSFRDELMKAKDEETLFSVVQKFCQ
ncbi:MAG: PTS sugar transporter subunit IIA [Bdellovibrionales bacterium]|nr:PTS sugar transporter subunit IIA [Bdellovibrionales bacterium]